MANTSEQSAVLLLVSLGYMVQRPAVQQAAQPVKATPTMAERIDAAQAAEATPAVNKDGSPKRKPGRPKGSKNKPKTPAAPKVEAKPAAASGGFSLDLGDMMGADAPADCLDSLALDLGL